jgi:S-adenosylmethionine-diacylgycerolhomoserine-N-methlytransferase
MSGSDSRGHAALMDSVYRRQRYIYDLTRKYYLFGRDRMIRELALAPGASVVEVGCGTGRNLVQIARLYPQAKISGLDASSEMLKTATQSLKRAGFESRVALAHGYAEALSPSMFGQTAPFDAILFPYSLSMIPDWKQALRAAAGALSPSGRVHVVDFGDLTGLGRIGERTLRAWLALFHVSPRTELLQTFESEIENERSRNLKILPGRYAFILNCSAKDLYRLTEAVADESQGVGKSGESSG